jgi:hypothetical protein
VVILHIPRQWLVLLHNDTAGWMELDAELAIGAPDASGERRSTGAERLRILCQCFVSALWHGLLDPKFL